MHPDLACTPAYKRVMCPERSWWCRVQAISALIAQKLCKDPEAAAAVRRDLFGPLWELTTNITQLEWFAAVEEVLNHRRTAAAAASAAGVSAEGPAEGAQGSAASAAAGESVGGGRLSTGFCKALGRRGCDCRNTCSDTQPALAAWCSACTHQCAVCACGSAVTPLCAAAMQASAVTLARRPIRATSAKWQMLPWRTLQGRGNAPTLNAQSCYTTSTGIQGVTSSAA